MSFYNITFNNFKLVINNNIIIFISNLIFISSYFLYSIRAPFPIYGLYNIFLPLEIFIIILSFLFCYKKYIIKETLIFLFLSNFVLIHLLFLEFTFDSSDIYFAFIKAFRLTVYLFVTYLFSKYFFDENKFLKILIKYSMIYLLLALVIKVSGINFLADTGYSFIRPVVFLSEPSAFAPIVSFLIAYSIFNRKLYILVLGLVSLYTINSGMVIASFLFTIFFILLFKNIKLLLFLLFFGTMITGLFYNILFEFHSFKRIMLIFQNFDLSSGETGQIRLQTLYNSFIYLSENNLLFSGMGLNTFLVYFDNKEDFLLRPFSFIHIIIQSFGLLGLISYLFMILCSLIILIIKKEHNLYIIFIAFLFPALFNSAEGTIMYKFHIMVMFIIFSRYFFIKKGKNN